MSCLTKKSANSEILIDEATLRSNLCSNLKALLAYRDMTQQQLAIAIGVTPRTIGGIYHERLTPSTIIVARIALFFGVSIHDLVTRGSGVVRRGSPRKPKKKK